MEAQAAAEEQRNDMHRSKYTIEKNEKMTLMTLAQPLAKEHTEADRVILQTGVYDINLSSS